MNKRDNNRHNAYIRVLGVLKGNSKFFNEVAVYKSAIVEYKTLMKELDEVGARIAKEKKSVTPAKNEKRRALAEKAAMIASLVAAYAYDIKDIELERSVNYTFTNLVKSRETEFDVKVKVIYSIAEKHKDQLEQYMLSSERLSIFKNEIDEFNKLRDISGVMRSILSADHKRTIQLMKEIEMLLDRKIDRMILALKEDHSRLYDAYMTARKIIDHK